nr:hypothetical protein [Nocardiopsis sp. CNT312]
MRHQGDVTVSGLVEDGTHAPGEPIDHRCRTKDVGTGLGLVNGLHAKDVERRTVVVPPLPVGENAPARRGVRGRTGGVSPASPRAE